VSEIGAWPRLEGTAPDLRRGGGVATAVSGRQCPGAGHRRGVTQDIGDCLRLMIAGNTIAPPSLAPGGPGTRSCTWSPESTSPNGLDRCQNAQKNRVATAGLTPEFAARSRLSGQSCGAAGDGSHGRRITRTPDHACFTLYQPLRPQSGRHQPPRPRQSPIIRTTFDARPARGWTSPPAA
jgi:hypothetical protein